MSNRPSRPLLAAALVALAFAPGAAAQPLPAGAATRCEPPARLSPAGAATCADPAARLADRRRAQAHAALRDQLAPAQRPALEENARAFEAFLGATCASPRPDADCLARFHDAKREDLRRWLAPPALEEADRDPDEAAALDRRLAALGLPADPVPRREAIAALQREGGLPPSGFLDTATAALIHSAEAPPRPAAIARPIPAPETPPVAGIEDPPSQAGAALPPGAFWSSFIPRRLAEPFAITGCTEPTASWSGRGLWIGGSPVPGETSYEIFGEEDPAGDRVFLVPPGGRPRIIRLLRDGTIGLEGTIPEALAQRGLAPGAIMRPCDPELTEAGPPAAAAAGAALGAALLPAAAPEPGAAPSAAPQPALPQPAAAQPVPPQASGPQPGHPQPGPPQPDPPRAVPAEATPPAPARAAASRSAPRRATARPAQSGRRGARATAGRPMAPKSRPAPRPSPRR